MHVETLIALAVQHALRKSMRGLADQMGIKVASLSDWKTGKSPIPEERVHQLAKIAGQDPGPWLLLIKAEQGEGDLAREWGKLAARLAGMAGAIALAAGAIWAGHEGTVSELLASVPVVLYAIPVDPIHIMRNTLIIGLLAYVLHWLATNNRRSDP